MWIANRWVFFNGGDTVKQVLCALFDTTTGIRYSLVLDYYRGEKMGTRFIAEKGQQGLLDIKNGMAMDFASSFAENLLWSGNPRSQQKAGKLLFETLKRGDDYEKDRNGENSGESSLDG